MMHDTIVAQCTPQGSGAIALIRLSGFEAVRIADAMARLPHNKKLEDAVTHTIHFGYVVNAEGSHIDQVLFLLMRAPKTFTGEDVVEITCHNNPFLVQMIVERALQCGARLARNGEFTQRAVETGKIDLVQAEAIYDLIHAQTADSLKFSLEQLEGTLSSKIAGFEKKVIEMLAFCEASFEFLDEEGIEFIDDIRMQMESLMHDVDTLVRSYSAQQYIKEGVRIALIGSVNVGKSSLFNALINKNRSIVTDIAGTTRDSVESGMYRNNSFLTFVDTAGIRSTDDRVEQEGIARSHHEMMHADIILLVIDGSCEQSEEQLATYASLVNRYAQKIIVVQNKIDVGMQHVVSWKESVPYVQVSAQQGLHIDRLTSLLDEKIALLKNIGEVHCLLNQRQYQLLSTFMNHMKQIQPMLYTRVDYELVSYHMRQALQALAEVSGRSVSESVLDQVFQSFCVGK